MNSLAAYAAVDYLIVGFVGAGIIFSIVGLLLPTQRDDDETDQ